MKRRRRRTPMAALAAFFAGPLLELAWWLMCREPRWVEMRSRASYAWDPDTLPDAPCEWQP